ncbi:MAG: hypothetical protein Ta2A_19080 [Treponemataceae bacterium]|nr:MAG: hypothetical protein Ta2A_19080 [Treponemataceae bacterium]
MPSVTVSGVEYTWKRTENGALEVCILEPKKVTNVSVDVLSAIVAQAEELAAAKAQQ